jgi:ATP-binding cassette subfamily F protein 3
VGQLQVSGVGFYYGASLVLDDVSLTLAPGKRVGLVGANGSGKSTLLRVCAADLVPSKGTVSLTRGSRVALLEQEALWSGSAPLLEAVMSADRERAAVKQEMDALETELAVSQTDRLVARYGDLQARYEALGGYQARHRAEQCLSGLGLERNFWSKPPGQLSGGQQRRAALARVLLQGADILLLDEPTNHLDLWGRGFLEDLLTRHNGSILVVSHDRYFLDRVTNATTELEGRKLYTYEGNYSTFLGQREERRRKAVEARQRVDEEKTRLQAYVRKYIAGQRHAQAQSRRKRLMKLETSSLPDLAPERDALRISLRHSRREGRVVFSTEGLGIHRGGRDLFHDLDLVVERGDRLAIIGANGSGKTSLLLTLMGQLEPSSGKVFQGHNIDLAYVPQETEPELLGSTPFDAVERVAPDWTIGQIRSYLARFLFAGDQVFQAVTSLSGGERSRLALACLLLSPANVLVLDEPTNHLDTDSCDALEEALAEYAGTLIMVTHDRRLIGRLAAKAVVIRGGRAQVAAPPFEPIWEEAASAPARKPRSSRPKDRKQRRTKTRSPEVIEQEIEAVEGELEELALRQSDPELRTRWEELLQVHREHERLQTRIDELIAEWEEAAEERENGNQ